MQTVQDPNVADEALRSRPCHGQSAASPKLVVGTRVAPAYTGATVDDQPAALRTLRAIGLRGWRMVEATDAALTDALLRTGTGDRRAFRLVYRLAAAKLFGICLRICGDRKAAEDVLQDVFVTIWLRADRFDPGRGSAMAWLGTMTRNRSLDWRRSYRPGVVSTDALAAVADSSPSAVDRLMLDERERRLHLCLEELEGPQRDAIRTAFFDGLTYAELAERAAIPLGTMKSRVRRGLLRLRECLDGAHA